MIPSDDSLAIVRLGGRRLVCQLLDMSRDDFHVRLPENRIQQLRRAKQVELHYHGERWRVEVVHDARSAVLSDSVFLKRLEELTPQQLPSPWTSFSTSGLSQQTDPRFILTLMLALIFACLALPGLGDHLGTAPKVKKGIHSIVEAFKGTAQ